MLPTSVYATVTALQFKLEAALALHASSVEEVPQPECRLNSVSALSLVNSQVETVTEPASLF